MKKGFAPIAVIVGIALIGVVAGGYAIARNYTKFEVPREFGPLKRSGESYLQRRGRSIPSPSPTPVASSTPTATPSSKIAVLPSPSPSTSPVSEPWVYTQPQGKYSMTLPADWIVNSTTATDTYSTTKFTGPNGYVAITFGSGKDPIGGCSESSIVILFDRSISGCFLLQKDGTQILSRAYTKDDAGIDFTIEAYINSPLSYHRPIVLDIINTIDIE